MRASPRLGQRGVAGGLTAALLLALAVPADATNGYFTHGYGTPSKGLAGAGVALPQDALAAATNPAGMAMVGKRYDAGLAVFNPNRQYTVRGAPSQFPGTFGLVPGTVESDSEIFFIPNVGANWAAGERGFFGFSLYGNGGMNTDYPTNTYFGSSPTGVDLAQLFVAPTYSRRFGADDNHAFGVAAILALQRFEIRGTQAFGAFSAAPTRVSNNGHDEVFGYGVRLGYLGQLSPRFAVGASYQSEIESEEFDSYAGIFAEQGDFDIPATATVGIAYQVTPGVTFVVDVQEIYYSEVRSVGNPLLPNLVTAPLGTDGGAGFGWDDATVFKAGLQWETAGSWTWRIGFSTTDQPIPSRDVFPNIVAPAVVEEHYTIGFTRQLGPGRALNLAVMRAPSSTVSGPNPLEVPGRQVIELQMDQWDLEVGFSWGF